MSKQRSSKKRDSDIEYGEFFRRARLRKGINQADLARALGFSATQMISNIERGLCRYPIARLSQVIRLLDLDAEETIRLILRQEDKKIRKILK